MQIMVKAAVVMALTGIGAAAMAQSIDPALDTNGDGAFSYPELLVAYPDLTEDGFAIMDTSGDGVIDADEVTVAVEGGLITPMDG